MVRVSALCSLTGDRKGGRRRITRGSFLELVEEKDTKRQTQLHVVKRPLNGSNSSSS